MVKKKKNMKKDYKELFEEALDEVRLYYNNAKEFGDYKTTARIESKFPQLKESEDEKIRKALIKDFRNYYEMYDKSCGEPKWGSDCLLVKDILDWLEMRKETLKSTNSILSDCVSDAKLEDCWHKVADSFPDSTREVICKDAIGNFFIGRYYKGIDSWEVSMYDDSPISNEDNPPVVMWCDIPSEKQKEQKPTEWKPLEESMEALLLAIEGKWDAIKPTGYMSRRLEDLYDGLVNTFNIRETYLPKTNYTEKDIEELKTLKSKIDASMEQKPTEWSEEDEANIDYLIDYFNGYENAQHKPMPLSTARILCYWLYNLKSKSLYPQSKQEWSEKDDEMIFFINELLENKGRDYFTTIVYDTVQNWLKNRFKSLRPQSHTVSIKDATKFGNLEYERGVKDGIQSEKNHQWKPSEEQMEALFTASERNDKFGSILNSLYRDLKKL